MSEQATEQVARKVAPQDYDGEDAEAIQHIINNRKKQPRFKVTEGENGKQSIKLDCEDDALGYIKLMHSLGTTDLVFSEVLMTQLANSTSCGERADQSNLNFALSVVQSIEPRDHIEALLAAQMATAHICAMDASRKYLNAEYVKPKENAEKAMNKFNRTFAVQMEALRKHRNGGKQTVRVEKVVVSDGGNAVVGDVHHGGGRREKNDG